MEKKKNRIPFKERALEFFSQLTLPPIAFQCATHYLSGIHLTPKDRKLKSHFILTLEKGLIEPSFYRRNIADAGVLQSRLQAGLTRLGLSGGSGVLLLPELSQKVFIFTFDDLPASQEEREDFIRFHIKKQLPLLPADNRLAFDTYSSDERVRVVASVAKAGVVREYEEIFQRLHVKVKMVGVPSISLLNLLGSGPDSDYILIDMEEDFFSLLAVVDGEAAMYRQKPFGMPDEKEHGIQEKTRLIVQEIANTANFIEDKEKTKISTLWVRLGFMNEETEVFRTLESSLPFSLHRIESSLGLKLQAEQGKVLSPLMGQIQ